MESVSDTKEDERDADSVSQNLEGSQKSLNLSERSLDMSSLISFSNLESVVKNIMHRFQKIEERLKDVDRSLENVDSELGMRATTEDLSTHGNMLAEKMDLISTTMHGQQSTLAMLEDALENSKNVTAAIDKRIDMAAKEKTIQDRVLREIQESLLEKANITELNMFEASIAGYTTKKDFENLIQTMNCYTRHEVTEKAIESINMLDKRFDEYARSVQVDIHFQEIKDWTSRELRHYARSEDTQNSITDIANDVKDQLISSERSLQVLDDKLRGLTDRLTSVYVELNDDVRRRATQEDMNKLAAELKRYALVIDVDAFQTQCTPKLKFCVDAIQKFHERLNAQDFAIQRVDEVLIDKASKYDVVVANSRIEHCMNRERGAKDLQKVQDRIEWIAKRLDHYVSAEHERFNQYRSPDYTEIFAEIKAKMDLKADQADLIEMYSLKADRQIVDAIATLQETIQRQLEYFSVTSLGIAKLGLMEAKVGESKTIRQNQKNQVLMQSESLWHWILRNEPPANLESICPPTKPVVAELPKTSPEPQTHSPGYTSPQLPDPATKKRVPDKSPRVAKRIEIRKPPRATDDSRKVSPEESLPQLVGSTLVPSLA